MFSGSYTSAFKILGKIEKNKLQKMQLWKMKQFYSEGTGYHMLMEFPLFNKIYE